MLIKELLHKVIGVQKLYFIEATNSIFKAARVMLKYKCGALLVCDNLSSKNLLGIITESEVVSIQGDLYIAINVISNTRRVLHIDKTLLNEDTKRVLRG